MPRIRLTIAYDGTEFRGWQKQPGLRTVEGALSEALLALLCKETTLIGASRTDSGVHAEGNVAVFDTDSRIPPDRFAYALNQKLPEDVRVLSSEACADDWHPRRVHSKKHYVYRVYNERILHPLTARYSQHCHAPLNLAAMKAAATCLLGCHDFTSFVNPQSQVLLAGGDAVRTLYAIDIEAEHPCRDSRSRLAVSERTTASAAAADRVDGADLCGSTVQPQRGYHGMITFTFRGNGFLYHMIRILTGTLLEAGSGRRSPESFADILAARDRRAAGMTAEAKGLTLVSIDYEEKSSMLADKREQPGVSAADGGNGS